jgi:hypothetical protein
MNRCVRVWAFLMLAGLVASGVMLQPGTTVMAASAAAKSDHRWAVVLHGGAGVIEGSR